MSDHPAPPDRIARITKEAQQLHVAASPTTNVAELNQVKSSMSRYGKAPTSQQIAQGVAPSTGTANNSRTRSTSRTASGSSIPNVQVAAPSSTMRSYTAPSGVYKISYPSNWSVYQEGSTGVTIAPQGGVGDIGGRTEVVYGAMINHYDPFGSSGMTSNLRNSGGSNSPYMGTTTLETATSDLLGQIRQQSPYLSTISNSTQKFNVSGGRALATALRGTDPSTGINERVNVITRQLEDGHLLYMLFVTPEQDASRYGPVLQAMVNSLQVSDTAKH
jgi:hypothetical protein